MTEATKRPSYEGKENVCTCSPAKDKAWDAMKAALENIIRMDTRLYGTNEVVGPFAVEAREALRLAREAEGVQT